MLDNYDLVIYWNYPGYNMSDIGTTSLENIKETHK